MTPFGLATVATERGGAVPAVVSGDALAPLSEVLAGDAPKPAVPTSVAGLLPEWSAWCQTIAERLASEPIAASELARGVSFLPPLSAPGAIYCAAANYRDHVVEMGVEVPDKAGLDPFHFQLPGSALTGHETAIHRPRGCVQLDWEAELAVVIGRLADAVSETSALDYVAGYTIANDVSARDAAISRHPVFGMNWLASKGQRSLLPLGPAVVPAEFIQDPMALDIRLSVNGIERQRSNTREMIYSVAEQVAALSRKLPLLPGDVIITGTPAGTGAAHGAYLEDGDEIAVSIDGLGELRNRVS